MWWRIAGLSRWRPVQHVLLGIVLLFKWVVWFPVMVIRHGFSGALDAADVRRAHAPCCRDRADLSTPEPSLPDARRKCRLAAGSGPLLRRSTQFGRRLQRRDNRLVEWLARSRSRYSTRTLKAAGQRASLGSMAEALGDSAAPGIGTRVGTRHSRGGNGDGTFHVFVVAGGGYVFADRFNSDAEAEWAAALFNAAIGYGPTLAQG